MKAALTLTDFLLARIAEDEDGVVEWPATGDREAARRTRVLAECEAKRRIVEYWNAERNITLQLLASVYADHPDYRESWRA